MTVGNTTYPAPGLNWVSWAKGYEALNKRKTWPIGQVWFNDKANILRVRNEAAQFGWMDNLIDGGSSGNGGFRKDYAGIAIPLVNADVTSTGTGDEPGRVVTVQLPVGKPPFDTPPFNNIEAIHGPFFSQLEAVLPVLHTSPNDWKGTASSYAAAKAGPNFWPDTPEAWKEMEAM